MAFTPVTITGTILNASGFPEVGVTVQFVLSAAMTDGVSFVDTTPINAMTRNDGSFSLLTYANDDPTTNPTGTYYNVTLTFPGQVVAHLKVVVPRTAAPTVDLFALVQLGSVPSTTTTPAVYVGSFNGRAGTVVPLAGDYDVSEIAGAAPLNSPALTGTPTAPTALPGTNTNQVATTAFVLANSGPGGGPTGALLATNNLSDVTNASTARTNLGLGSAATQPSSAFDAAGAASAVLTSSLQKSSNLGDLGSASVARTNLGLGSAATQAASSFDAAGAAAAAQTASLQKSNNLSDVGNVTTARANLGLGSAATQASSAFDTAGAASTVQNNLNTEVARAQAAEALLAPRANPTLTGTVTVPTPTNGDNSTKAASTAFVQTAIAGSVAGVSSFNTRTGAVTLTKGDVTGTGLAPADIGADASGAAATAQAASLQKTSNLSDLTSAATARTNLGLGSAATQAASAFDAAGAAAAEQTRAQAAEASLAPLAGATFTGAITAPTISSSGLTGATALSRYVGATSAGAPTSGNFLLGDWVIDQTGKIWVCTAAGSPGTWATNNAPVTSFNTRTGDIILSKADVTATGLSATDVGADIAGTAAAAQASSLQKSSNLSDLTNAATARNNLGLGSAATQPTSAFDAAGTASAAVATALAGLAPAEFPAAVQGSGLTHSGIGQTINGVVVTAGMRILDTVAGVNSGLYVAASGAWTRPVDFATGSNAQGKLVDVDGGGLWLCVSNSTVTVDTTSQVWTEIDASVIQAGTGLSKSGNTLNLALTKALVTATGLAASDVGAIATGATAGGDLSGTLPNPGVAKVNGIAVTGTPSVGQVLTATSSTAANWQTSSGGTLTNVNGGTPSAAVVTIQVRRGTAAAWTSSNPVLADGEIGIETDNTGSTPRKMKIGDGTSTWTALGYQAGGGGVSQSTTIALAVALG